jgi:hypothetical protein
MYNRYGFQFNTNNNHSFRLKFSFCVFTKDSHNISVFFRRSYLRTLGYFELYKAINCPCPTQVQAEQFCGEKKTRISMKPKPIKKCKDTFHLAHFIGPLFVGSDTGSSNVLYCKLQLCEGSFINDVTIYGERVNDIVTMTM